MMIRKFLIIVLIICDLLMLVVIAHGGQVKLQWDPNPTQTDDGYRIYMRADGQRYDYSKPAWPTDGKNHSETNCTIDALISGVRYHFVARAYKGVAESGDSNEVSYIGFDPVKPIGIRKQKEENNMFLISDAQSKDSVDYFEVEIDGAVIRSDAQVDGDRARLHHELTGLSMGEHTVRVSAVNGWGKSVWTDPFVFVAQLPGPVFGVGLSAE